MSRRQLGLALAVTGLIASSLPMAAQAGQRIISYDLDIAVVPEAVTDYAGFIEIMHGQRPSRNKKDSVKAYPHMTGEAVMQVAIETEPATSLAFYLHGELRVHEILIDNVSAEFTQQPVFYPRNYSAIATQATVELDRPRTGILDVTVKYGGMFNPSYATSPSNYMRIDREGAYLRAHGYSLWFPVLTGPQIAGETADFRRITVRTPEPFRAALTGRKVSDELVDGTYVSSWEVGERDSFALQLTVRPFVEASRHGIHLYHLDEPRSAEAASEILEMVRQLVDLYRDHYKASDGYEEAHVVELPNFASGISSGNTIGITSGQWRGFSLTDEDTGLETLIAHELVHPFVQPEVSDESPLAALFIEGFPAYFHLPVLAQMLGDEWYTDHMQRVENKYLERRKTGKTPWGTELPEEKAILEITRDEIGRYKDTFILSDRVLLFLHDLRRRAGVDGFKKMTRELRAEDGLTPAGFMDFIQRFVPIERGDLRLWLETSEYPERLRL
jgi:hypothetical protein